MQKLKSLPWIFGILVFTFTGCQSEAITVIAPWARTASRGNNSAVYFTLDNQTDTTIKLISVKTDISKDAQIHLSSMNDNDMMTMEEQESVLITARDQITFQPGGLHIMLIDLNQDIKIGDMLNIQLIFENHEPMVVEIPVKNE